MWNSPYLSSAMVATWNVVICSRDVCPKNGPLVQFIVQFSAIKIQEKEELSSIQVPKNQVNFMNLVL